MFRVLVIMMKKKEYFMEPLSFSKRPDLIGINEEIENKKEKDDKEKDEIKQLKIKLIRSKDEMVKYKDIVA